MEPKLPTPNANPERMPVNAPQSLESFPMPPSPETGFESEQPREQRGEATPGAVNAAPVLPTPVLPSVPAPAPSASPTAVTTDDDLPSVAGDDDLIEKEWVDKAKKIIQETRDDPHRREREVGRLQADYLRKRYGKELGATEQS